MVVIITEFPFLLPNITLHVRHGGGGGPDTIDFDFRRRQPDARADLSETEPVTHGTDSADTWTSEAPVVSLGAPSRGGQGSRRLPDPAPAPGVGASSEDGGRRD